MAERTAIPAFTGTVNRVRETELPTGGLREALDVDIDNAGKLLPRKASVQVGSGGHSAWGHPAIPYGLYVSEGRLIRLPDTEEIATVANNRRMSYCELHGRTYFTNGVESGCLNPELMRWGMDRPPSPTVVVTSGALIPGQYQVAFTVLFNNNGEESAASPVETVDVGQDQGIVVTPLPVHPDITHVRLYASPPNGSELYHVATVPNGVNAITISHSPDGHPIETLHKLPFPPCDRIASFKRRIIGSIGKWLVFSDIENPSLQDPRHNWLPFSEPIVFLGPVDDGVYVGTSKRVWFCAGNDPKDWSLRVVDVVGVIPQDSAVPIPADTFPGERLLAQGSLVPWWSNDGELVIGRSEGYVQRVSASFSVSRFARCQIVYREQEHVRQLISLFQTPVGEDRQAPRYPLTHIHTHGISL